MRRITRTRRFVRDLRRMHKRGKNLTKLSVIVEALQKGKPLAAKHRPHQLKGEWAHRWECHIEPDWLLVYEVTEDTVYLAGTGTHADLFK